MPPSSRDLIEEQLRELLEEQHVNMREGLTLRSLNRRLSEMEKREWERSEAAGTGRFNIPPPIILDAVGRPSKRPSNRPPWVEKIMASKPVSTALTIALVAVVSHMAARCGVLAVAPPQGSVAPPASK